MVVTVDEITDKYRRIVANSAEDVERFRAEITKLDKPERIGRYLALFGSHERAYPLWASTIGEPAEVYWRVMSDWWNACDSFGQFHRLLLSGFRKRIEQGQSPITFLDKDDRNFFDQLPDPIKIYRGCGRRKVRRMAWTTERKVAEFFGKGGRFPTPHDPVIATAEVAKYDVFLAIASRKESEVVIDPHRIKRLRLEALPVLETRISPQQKKQIRSLARMLRRIQRQPLHGRAEPELAE